MVHIKGEEMNIISTTYLIFHIWEKPLYIYTFLFTLFCPYGNGVHQQQCITAKIKKIGAYQYYSYLKCNHVNDLICCFNFETNTDFEISRKQKFVGVRAQQHDTWVIYISCLWCRLTKISRIYCYNCFSMRAFHMWSMWL